MQKDKLIKMLIGFLPLLLLFLDPPEGMDPKAWIPRPGDYSRFMPALF